MVRVGKLERGQETKVESIGFRKRNNISGEEGRDKGLCGFSQLQREEPNDQNIMEALPGEQKGWKECHDPILEARRNLWTE